MKKIFVLIALASATAFAVAATTGTDSFTLKDKAALQVAELSVTSEFDLPRTHPTTVADEDTKQVSTGKVTEVIDSPMYTYLRVSGEKGSLWLASYKTDVTKGATIKYSGGVAMPNFYSKALNRTFDVIIFVDSLVLVME